MAGTIVVDRIESDASYASTINVAGQITFSNTVNFGVFAGTAPVAGFYLPATNTLAFTTASTERMRIDNAGNVGIGTNTPGNGLTVSRSSGECVVGITNTGTGSAWVTLTPGSSGAAYIHNPTTRNTIFTTNSVERMSIDSSGVVGLSGTASYTPRFEVMSIVDSNNQGLRMSGSGDTAYQHISATSNTLNFQQYVSSAWRTAAQIVGNAAADFKFNSGYGSAATAYGCRAWVNFNGTSAAINASANITSVTRTAAGTFTVAFTNSMPDANYVVVGTASSTQYLRAVQTSTSATGSVVVRTIAENATAVDTTGNVHVAITR